MTDRFVTIKQLVDKEKGYCPVSEDLVRYWIRHSGLPIHRASKTMDPGKGKILIQVSEFFDWMEQRRKLRENVIKSVSQEAREFVQELLA